MNGAGFRCAALTTMSAEDAAFTLPHGYPAPPAYPDTGLGVVSMSCGLAPVLECRVVASGLAAIDKSLL